MKFFIQDFFSKYDQIRSLLKKSLMENIIFCAVIDWLASTKLFSYLHLNYLTLSLKSSIQNR